jgi:hypothetical protein
MLKNSVELALFQRSPNETNLEKLQFPCDNDFNTVLR